MEDERVSEDGDSAIIVPSLEVRRLNDEKDKDTEEF